MNQHFIATKQTNKNKQERKYFTKSKRKVRFGQVVFENDSPWWFQIGIISVINKMIGRNATAHALVTPRGTGRCDPL